ncbi:MAG: hypothetical protein L6V93_21275 [Clostridiales bacterium]|nr:MAG: hypothetical protein L6V93_21275 [Clostridiales bacterium]
MVILIVILASVLVYVNQTPVFFTKAIRLFNKNYEYKTPTVELESTEGVFVTALSDARAVIGTKEGINVYSHSLKKAKKARHFSGENPVIKHNGDKILVFHKGSEKAFFYERQKKYSHNRKRKYSDGRGERKTDILRFSPKKKRL